MCKLKLHKKLINTESFVYSYSQSEACLGTLQVKTFTELTKIYISGSQHFPPTLFLKSGFGLKLILN